MIKKIITILTISMLLLVFASCAKKEVEVEGKTYDTSKNYTIAISQSADKKTFDSMRKGFVTGMKKLGYLEDVNVTYKYENASGNKSFAEQIADAYSGLGADLIVTIGDVSTIAMADKIKDTPIVFVGVGDAERLGFSDQNGSSLVSNMTGVIDSHLISERLKYINTNYPDIKRLGIIYEADNVMSKYDIDYFKFNATAYDIDIYTVSIKKMDQIDAALNEILPKVDAIALLNDYMVDSVASTVIERAESEGKEVFGDTDEHHEQGAIVTTSRDYQLVGEKASELVNAILKENKAPNEVKVETVDFRVS